MLSGCGAVGSALPWGGRGRGFKSRHSDHLNSDFTLFCKIGIFIYTLLRHLYQINNIKKSPSLSLLYRGGQKCPPVQKTGGQNVISQQAFPRK